MIAGVGFRSDATLHSILDALTRAGAGRCGRIAMPQDKIDHPAARALCEAGYVVIGVPGWAISTCPTISDSAAARAAYGTGSVAEACAIIAAGAGARLAAPRAISLDRMATAALALTGELT